MLSEVLQDVKIMNLHKAYLEFEEWHNSEEDLQGRACFDSELDVRLMDDYGRVKGLFDIQTLKDFDCYGELKKPESILFYSKFIKFYNDFESIDYFYI